MTTIPATTSTAPTIAGTEPGAATVQQTFGILSLIVAIVSVVAGLVPIGSIVAIVLGGIALQREPASRKLATAGVLIGAIPIAIGTLVTLMVPFGLLAAFSFGAFGFWF
jgi:hypothetical protein